MWAGIFYDQISGTIKLPCMKKPVTYLDYLVTRLTVRQIKRRDSDYKQVIVSALSLVG